MTRLHGALHRATEGKAQILPPDVGFGAGQDLDSSQPAFSVPWPLDAVATAGRQEEVPAEPPAFPSLPAIHLERRPSDTGEKLVGITASEDQASLAVAIEQYRKLAAALHHAQADKGLKLIMVASANPGEGKSLTASNLALTLSVSYQRRVLLIDADLRRPSLHDIFGVPNKSGLSDGLARDSVEGLAVLELSTLLSILPSGRPMEDPTGALTSRQMRRVLDEARAHYDWVVIDTPPVGLLSDAKLLADMVDGVVLVVEAAKSQYQDLLRAIEAIGRGRLVGAVLNRFQDVSGSSKYYASYYRGSYAPKAQAEH
jgi:capsular exopolysaccharide synthesis family protein